MADLDRTLVTIVGRASLLKRAVGLIGGTLGLQLAGWPLGVRSRNRLWLGLISAAASTPVPAFFSSRAGLDLIRLALLASGLAAPGVRR